MAQTDGSTHLQLRFVTKNCRKNRIRAESEVDECDIDEEALERGTDSLLNAVGDRRSCAAGRAEDPKGGRILTMISSRAWRT